MLKKGIKESSLFKAANILLLDRNKSHFEVVKEKSSLLTNTEIDNSGFIRAVIEYYYDNPEQLDVISGYLKEYKGFNIMGRLEKMLKENKTPQQIEAEIGIDPKTLKKALTEK